MDKQTDVTSFFEMAPESLLEMPEYNYLNRVEQVAVFRSSFLRLFAANQVPPLEYAVIHSRRGDIISNIIGHHLTNGNVKAFIEKAVGDLNTACGAAGLDMEDTAKLYTPHVDVKKMETYAVVPPELIIANPVLKAKLFPVSSAEVDEQPSTGRTR